MRILVVEGEATVARFLRQALEEEGHAVDTAADGVEGGNLAHINPYDLILLDVQLPRMDGLQLASELRRTGLQCPILMLTSRDSTQDVVRGLVAGADDYLTKPFALEELLARVNEKALRSTIANVEHGVAERRVPAPAQAPSGRTTGRGPAVSRQDTRALPH